MSANIWQECTTKFLQNGGDFMSRFLFYFSGAAFFIGCLTYDIRLFMDPGTDNLKRKRLKINLIIDALFALFFVGFFLISILGG